MIPQGYKLKRFVSFAYQCSFRKKGGTRKQSTTAQLGSGEGSSSNKQQDEVYDCKDRDEDR